MDVEENNKRLRETLEKERKEAEFHQKKARENFDRNYGTGGSGCFPGCAQVLCPHGSVEIEQISIGDQIFGFDFNVGEAETCKVIHIYRYPRRRVWQIEFDTGEMLQTTASHTFFSQRGWVTAGRVTPGDELLRMTQNHGTSEFVRVTKKVCLPLPVDVFNLVVSGQFTFIADGTVANCFTHFRQLQRIAWIAKGVLYGGVERFFGHGFPRSVKFQRDLFAVSQAE